VRAADTLAVDETQQSPAATAMHSLCYVRAREVYRDRGIAAASAYTKPEPCHGRACVATTLHLFISREPMRKRLAHVPVGDKPEVFAHTPTTDRPPSPTTPARRLDDRLQGRDDVRTRRPAALLSHLGIVVFPWGRSSRRRRVRVRLIRQLIGGLGPEL
jgi:hypothetical protein